MYFVLYLYCIVYTEQSVLKVLIHYETRLGKLSNVSFKIKAPVEVRNQSDDPTIIKISVMRIVSK